MTSTFGRTAMLAGTALAFGVLAGAAHAQSALQGEGSSLATPTYNAEFGVIPGDSHYSFLEYSTSSGKGQAAVIANLGTTGSGVPSGQAVDWGASDAAITASNNTFTGLWNAAPTGLVEAGPYIQIPLLGVAIAVPFNNPGIKTNAALRLNDSDLCGIFSGKISTWEGLSHPVKGVTGTFHVYYRLDGSGTTFLLTQHLSAQQSAGNAICTTGASGNSNITFATTTTFAGLFPSGVPSNFIGETGSSGIATAMQGDASSLGYLSPDYTNVPAVPATGFGTLKAASVINTNNGGAYQPTYQYTALGLSKPGFGATNKTPPSVANAGNQLLWVPALPVVNAGYPVVGYTNWLLPQCFNESDNAARGAGLDEFLTDHYNGLGNAVVNQHGFVVLGETVTINGVQTKNPTGQAYVKAIKADFLANPGAGDLGIDSTVGCAKTKTHAAYPGRPNHSGS